MANGIPNILNQIANVGNIVTLVTSDFSVLFGFNNWSWGIYKAGTNIPAIIPDSIVSMEYKKEYKISDYPIELGTFSNYNKVALPFISTVRMSVGSGLNDRGQFLTQLAELASSVELFDIVTPEYIYLNANIIDYNYQRTSTNGAGMIVADIKLMEVRTTGLTMFSNTKSDSDNNSKNLGQLAPQNTNETPQSVGL